jgi:hypothetical protein
VTPAPGDRVVWLRSWRLGYQPSTGILTLDRRDFRAVRPLGRHKAFRILPDGSPCEGVRDGIAATVSLPTRLCGGCAF